MNQVEELLQQLILQGIQVWPQAGKLRYAGPQQQITPQLLDQLKTHKAALLQWLSEPTYAPLSIGQRGLWFIHQQAPDNVVYTVSMTCRIRAALDVTLLGDTIQLLVNRHAALRTRFTWQAGALVQQIDGYQAAAIEILDIGDCAEAALLQQIHALHERPFDLSTGPLLRTTVLRHTEQSYTLLLSIHHIVVDGWSIYQLVDELFTLYAALRRGAVAELPVIQHTYADYIAWQQALLERDGARLYAYWQAQLGGELPVLQLPTDFPRPAQHTLHGISQPLRLSPMLSAQLKRIARQNNCTLYMVLLAAYQLFLHRYSGQAEILVGLPVAGRSQPEFAEIIGYFVSRVVVRANLRSTPTFVHLLAQAKAQLLAALDHQDYPFARLVEQLNPQRDLSRPPLFQASFVLQQPHRAQALVLQANAYEKFGLTVESIPLPLFAGQDDIALELLDTPDGLVGYLKSNADLFTAATLARMVRHFQVLLEGIAAEQPLGVNQPLAQLPLLTQAEQQQLLVEWNNTATAYPKAQCIHQLFEEQAARTPDAVAVVMAEAKRAKGQADKEIASSEIALAFHTASPLRSATAPCLTYHELNNRANQLAHHLQSLGVGPESVVGICMERSPELLIALYAVLKAGGAYLPLEPNYPAERIAWLLADARAAVVLTQEDLLPLLPAARPILCLDRDEPLLAANPTHNPTSPVTPAHLAYIIYTSGSTGRPKGVMIQHSSLVNYLWWAQQVYGTGAALDFPFHSSFAFDLTVTSLFLPLLTGGSLVIYPEHADGYPPILDVLQDDRVDVIKLTPAHLALIQGKINATRRLKKLIVGGEELKTEQVRKLTAQRSELEIYNEYGPTEATVGCMLHRFDPNADQAGAVPIGKPAANVQIYLLDPAGAPTPIGVIGEICIAGQALARGYWDRPALTAERFVPHPLAPGQRLYRTGDLGRWQPATDAATDPQLEFLGRRDHQIKLRGFRVELGEIEAELLSHAAIRHCVVDLQPLPSAQPQPVEPVAHCVRCGLPANHPDAQLNAAGVCQLCLTYAQMADKARQYFKTMNDFADLAHQMKARRSGDYDCLLLLSGGKDSTYVLVQLVKVLGLKVLAFTLDNGFIAESAKANIRKTVSELGVDHVFATTPAMNAIFVDSLQRFSNVCNGCFKTIYTLSMNLAQQQGIRYIVTGLSRGQIFETRLQELFRQQHFAAAEVDQMVLAARKIYHRTDDAVAQHLDVTLFQDDTTFQRIQIIDFYRYCDVALDEMLALLAQHTSWVRPADTGRSTNCLINEVGIYVHKKERGYHNYALPYSWDVILGHKSRQAALEELDDNIDEANVQRILTEIGYTVNAPTPSPAEQRLVAYVVADRTIIHAELSAYLARRLPAYMIPAAFVQLEELPLTPNGKLDRSALRLTNEPTPIASTTFAPPQSATEEAVARLWREVLGLDEISGGPQGAANFFALGGHSLLTVQLMQRVVETFGVTLPLQQFFATPTIAGIAQAIDHLRLPIAAENQPDVTPQTLPRCLVPLRTTGVRPPFFCVHPVAGVAFPYYELAAQLAADQPFYGFQSIGLNDDGAPLSTVEAMATQYITALQTIQPNGPYAVGGWSFGAYVAYEMAQQLQRRDQTVARLVIIDSPPPMSKGLAHFLGGLHFFGTAIAPALSGYAAQYWSLRCQQTQAILPNPAQLLRVTLANARASWRYRLQPYPGRITLLRSEQNFGAASQRADLGWGDFASGGVDVVPVPGEHMTLVHQPHVAIVAEQLMACLAKKESA